MPAEPREIELKLEIDPAHVDSLKAHDRLSNLPRRTLSQITTYYDTPKETLRGAGYALRVRQAGRKRVQTLKGSGNASAAIFDRAEWERRIDGPDPDLAALSDTPVAGLLAKTEGADLGPLFTARVKRTVWRIENAAGEIELVLDEGEIISNGQRAPVREVELELVKGDPQSLFALARTLAITAPLKIGVLTKYERGLMLRDGAIGQPVKAFAVPLVPGMTAGAAFQAIALSCIRQFRLNEPLFAEARDGAALHQARVALRRLRSAFSIFAAITAEEGRGDIREGLRWISSILGEARDLDVFVNKPTRAGSGWQDVQALALAARDEAFDMAIAALGSLRFQTLMLDLVEWLAFGPWRASDQLERAGRDQPVELFAHTVLDRFWRKVKKRGRNLGQLADEPRHELRIVAKKLRYGSEFFAALYTGKKAARRHKAFLAALEELQTHLGDLNDIVTASALDARFPGLHDAGVAVDRAALKAAAEAAMLRLADAKPFWR